jgi:hypothetical protein
MNSASNYTYLDYFFPGQFYLTNGQTLDAGTLIVPETSAHLTINLVDSAGQPLNTDDPYLPPSVLQLIARRTNATAFAAGGAFDVQTNRIVLNLFPGRWTFEAFEFNVQLNPYGYASIAPFSIDVTPGLNEYNLRFEPVPLEPQPPILTANIKDDVAPHFRIYQQKLWPVEIESSTDLVHWTFHANAFFNREFPTSDLKTNTFYRAMASP